MQQRVDLPTLDEESFVDRVAEELWDRFEERMSKSGKKGRKDEGSGNPVVGMVLREHRTRAGLSMRALSESTGLNHTFIGRVEKGKRGMSVESLAAIWHALGNEFVDDYIRAVYRTSHDPFDSGADRPEATPSEQEIQAQPRATQVDEDSYGSIVVSGDGPDCFLWVASDDKDQVLGHSFVRLSDSQ